MMSSLDQIPTKNFYEQQSESFVAFFMSDLHLSSSTKNEIQKLEFFVDHLKKTNSKANLYFMGDTFDFWFGYASPIEKQIQPLLNKIKDYKKQSGAEVVFFEGNHDIHLGPHFNELGFEVEPDRKIVTLGNKTVALEHGDMFDPEDKGYLFLRRFLRSNFMRLLGVTLLPTRLVSGLGEFFSNLSAKKTRVVNLERQKKSQEKFLNYGQHILASTNTNVFIAGHTHQRIIHQAANGTVINLGTWCDGQPMVCGQTSKGFEFYKI